MPIFYLLYLLHTVTQSHVEKFSQGLKRTKKHSKKIEILEKALEINSITQVKVSKCEKWLHFEKWPYKEQLRGDPHFFSH